MKKIWLFIICIFIISCGINVPENAIQLNKWIFDNSDYIVYLNNIHINAGDQIYSYIHNENNTFEIVNKEKTHYIIRIFFEWNKKYYDNYFKGYWIFYKIGSVEYNIYFEPDAVDNLKVLDNSLKEEINNLNSRIKNLESQSIDSKNYNKKETNNMTLWQIFLMFVIALATVKVGHLITRKVIFKFIKTKTNNIKEDWENCDKE